jgi:hypothetical protein
LKSAYGGNRGSFGLDFQRVLSMGISRIGVGLNE